MADMEVVEGYQNGMIYALSAVSSFLITLLLTIGLILRSKADFVGYRAMCRWFEMCQ